MSDGASTQSATPGVARRPGHPVELRALHVLHDHQPAGFVHVADPARPVAAAARQNDRHRTRAAVLGQRPEEDVDRQRQFLMPLRSLSSRRPPEMIISFLGGIR